MILEFLGRFFALEWGWVFSVFLDHLFWLFVLASVVVLMYPPRKQWWGFIFIVFFLWTFGDLSQYIGWVVHPAFGAIYFILFAVPAVVFLEKRGVLSKWNLPFQVFGLIAIWMFFTFIG